MSQKNSKIWVEKYIPQNLNEYKFQSPTNEEFVKDILETKNLPNLMIGGIQGTGKTALSHMLMLELGVVPRDIMHINASSDNGIDNVRNDIETFCSMFANGEYRVVILEEADGLTSHAQKALRAVMDKYQTLTRFIFTCNYPHKIIDALHSRCESLYLDKFAEGVIALHGAEILTEEGITYKNETLIDHVKANAPDMRKFIQSLQQSSRNPENELQPVMIFSGGSHEALENWEKEWTGTPSFAMLVKLVDGVDNTNFEMMFQIAYENFVNMDEGLRNKAYALVPQYLQRGYVVAYQPLNMHGFLVEIFDQV